MARLTSFMQRRPHRNSSVPWMEEMAKEVLDIIQYLSSWIVRTTTLRVLSPPCFCDWSETTYSGNTQMVLILSCKTHTPSATIWLGQLFGTRLAPWTMATVGTSIFIDDIALSKMRQVVTIAKGPSKISLPGWTSSVNVFLSTDGNTPRHFGQYHKRLETKRRARLIVHDVSLTNKISVTGPLVLNSFVDFSYAKTYCSATQRARSLSWRVS